jgi:hypothetical protein
MLTTGLNCDADAVDDAGAAAAAADEDDDDQSVDGGGSNDTAHIAVPSLKSKAELSASSTGLVHAPLPRSDATSLQSQPLQDARYKLSSTEQNIKLPLLVTDSHDMLLLTCARWHAAHTGRTPGPATGRGGASGDDSW